MDEEIRRELENARDFLILKKKTRETYLLEYKK